MGPEKLSEEEVRERLGRPSDREVALYMQGMHRVIRGGVMDRLKNERESIKQALRVFHSTLTRQGRPPSRVKLSAFFVDDLGDRLFLAERTDPLNAGNDAAFRYSYDVQYGMQTVTGMLFTLGDKDMVQLERGINRYFAQQNDFHPDQPIGDTIEDYLKVKTRLVDLSKKGENDPTKSGLRLVDAFIDTYIKGKKPVWNLKTAKSFEYTLAGAELARDTYREVYGSAGVLYP